jgi:hypothetical protein
MRSTTALLMCAVLWVVGGRPGFAGPTTEAHDKTFWRKILADDYKVPPGASPAALIQELSGYLRSPDPELRDEFAYQITVAWMYRDKRLSKDEVQILLREWMANLRSGLGEVGTDSVLLRSFSALELSVIAALDNEKGVLDAADFAALVSAGIEYMNGERDLRGYEPQQGWFHATAHTADLLKFLGRNRRLSVADQGKILDAIASKLRADGHVFAFGENERMASAVRSLLQRPDLDHARFETWLARFPQQSKALLERSPLDPAGFAELQNSKDLLRSLYVQLSLAGQAGPGTQAASVLDCLRKLE